ncbi:MAG: hypothetical protein KAQ98_01410 [Bacteriovoracaceae bacterium]|nr:hypothetical protein [Bacteriovoracaceae bacterium]
MRYIFFITLIFFSACDFTPRIQKEILVAQNNISKQKFQKAIRKYEEVLNDDCPQEIRIKIYYQLGQLYSIHLFNNLKAISYFRKVKNESDDPKWLCKSEERIAEINFSYLANYKGSIESYRKLTRFVPSLQNHEFYEYRLGLSYKRISRFDKSQDIFRSILKKPKHKYYVHAFYEMGIINFKKENWEKAVKYWILYIRKEKRRDNIVRTKFLMANAYETMENLKQAYDLYYSLLGEYPNTEVVKNRLNSIYERKIARRR